MLLQPQPAVIALENSNAIDAILVLANGVGHAWGLKL